MKKYDENEFDDIETENKWSDKCPDFEPDDETFRSERRLEKAEKSLLDIEEDLLKEAIKKEEKNIKKHRNKIQGVVNDITKKHEREEKYKGNSVLDNLGFDKSKRKDPGVVDKLMNRLFNAKQRMALYILVIVVALVAIALKLFGVV